MICKNCGVDISPGFLCCDGKWESFDLEVIESGGLKMTPIPDIEFVGVWEVGVPDPKKGDIIITNNYKGTQRYRVLHSIDGKFKDRQYSVWDESDFKILEHFMFAYICPPAMEESAEAD